MSDSSGMGNLLILALPVLLIVWMVWTQRRRQQQTQQMQSSIGVGDRVVTTSGLYGTVRMMSERTVELEVAPGVIMTYDRRAIGMKAPVDAGTDTPAPQAPQVTETTQAPQYGANPTPQGETHPGIDPTSDRTDPTREA